MPEFSKLDAAATVIEFRHPDAGRGNDSSKPPQRRVRTH